MKYLSMKILQHYWSNSSHMHSAHIHASQVVDLLLSSGCRNVSFNPLAVYVVVILVNDANSVDIQFCRHSWLWSLPIAVKTATDCTTLRHATEQSKEYLSEHQ